MADAAMQTKRSKPALTLLASGRGADALGKAALCFNDAISC